MFSGKVIGTGLLAGATANGYDWLWGSVPLKRGFSGSVDLFLEGKGAVNR
jgi:hypothetical protein